MADAVARREARRRKILENSKNRLKLITGESTELNNDVNIDVNNDSTIIKNTFTQNNDNETFLVNSKNCLIHESNIELNPILDGNTRNDNENIIEQSTSSNHLKTSTLCVPYSKRVFIILLAIIIRLLFIFQMQFCVRDSIIYPFIIAEVTLQLLNKDNDENVSPLFTTILLFSRLTSVQIHRFMRAFQILEHFLQDFSLYFFTFITVHFCLGAIVSF